ncbi:MAG TPA: sulfur relay protein DsrH, partial [Thermotoga naphthophila]|nr:sulfur relay protein DsrH [Thermotoga petrophila]
IKDDFLARGYSEEDSKVPLITYSGFIDLLEGEEKFIG